MATAATTLPHAPARPRALDVSLWVAQGLLFLAFVMAGVMKTTQPVDLLAQKMTWVPRFSPGMVRFIGTSELLGGLGVLLPAATRILPWLTPVAAGGLLAVMGLAAAHHLGNGEAAMVPINLVLGGLAAFVLWARGKKARIAPRAGA